MKSILLASILFFGIQSSNSQDTRQQSSKFYPKSLVNYDSFKALVNDVENHRAQRLINFETFLRMAGKDNVIILDTRSAYFYNRRHIKGAINLPFTEFTQERLNQIIPDKNTSVLIYCNNNFGNDKINFASKIARPRLDEKKELTLALNIPTYLNLYGYGYKSIFELDELLSVFDKRVQFEGTDLVNSPRL